MTSQPALRVASGWVSAATAKEFCKLELPVSAPSAACRERHGSACMGMGAALGAETPDRQAPCIMSSANSPISTCTPYLLSLSLRGLDPP